jgi:hypothetical protein
LFNEFCLFGFVYSVLSIEYKLEYTKAEQRTSV